MTPMQAREIIEGLAGGVDAATGEVLKDNGPLSHPHVIRALFHAARALEQVAAQSARKADAPGKAGQPWSGEEDERLTAAFDAGMPIAELARAHERSRGAISSRLMRFGRLPRNGEDKPPA